MTTEHWVTVTFLLFIALMTVAIVGIVLLRQRDELRNERDYWQRQWRDLTEQVAAACKRHHQTLDDMILQKDRVEGLQAIITNIRQLCDEAIPPDPVPLQSATPSPRPSAPASGR